MDRSNSEDGLWISDKASNRDDILVLNYTGWIFNLLTDRSKVHSLSIDDFNRVKNENEILKNNLNEKLMEGNNAFIKDQDLISSS